MFCLLSEPFLESIPQVHIIMIIIFLQDQRAIDPYSRQTILTLSSSLFSATYGMSKFLRTGPCRLVPYGKFKLGFFLLMLNIACMLGGKAFIITLHNWVRITDDESLGVTNSDGLQLIIRWILASIVPQMLFVSTYLQWCELENQQSPISVVDCHFSVCPER